MNGEPESVHVVKIGGNVVDSPKALSSFISRFAALPGHKILVHGGGKEATRLSEALGIETTFVKGRRVTSAETIPVVTMVYAGLVNKRVVASLQKNGVRALGLSGADASVITAVRRSPEPVDFGYVGDISADGVDVGFIFSMLNDGIVPVFCAVMSDGNGQLLNCNADSVAASVALACAGRAKVRLTYCFELPGVLADPDDKSSVIADITPESFRRLVGEGRVSGGMIPKIENSINAVLAGVDSVVITGADLLGANSGTTIHL